MYRRLTPRLRLAPLARCSVLLGALLLVAACSPYKFIGDQLIEFGREEILPHEMAGGDLMIGCSAATSFTAPTIAFERVGTDVNQMSILLLVTTGVCSELDALESELAYLRALHQENPLAAQDARYAQKRAHELAARRQYDAWKRFVAHYGEPVEGKCPKFGDDFDELAYIVGLLGGMQAVINDAQTGMAVGVPRDIAPRVGHMVRCVDNEKWWDLPLSVQAALWHILPMNAPPDVEPMKIMEEIAHRGERDGVRLGHVIWAMTAYNSGDEAMARRALRDFAEAGRRFTPNTEYVILDRIAVDVLTGISDRMWTEATGHRTPMGALGTFWDDVPVGADIDDLL